MKTKEQVKLDWYEFVNSAFIEWRGSTRRGLSEFADYVGISQSLMSHEMKKDGSVPRDQKTISAWANKYGLVIYEVLDLPFPTDPIDSLPEPTRSIAREIRETLAEYKVAGDSPKAMELQEEILKKYGFEIISKEI
jgi:hypothetical protein